MTMEDSKETTVEAPIVKQLEYYFGDFNLTRDKFLKNQISLDDGWVPLSVLTTFNRMKELSTDCELIARAVSNSGSELLQLSEDKLKVRRNPDKVLPSEEEVKKSMEERTFNIKRFPETTTREELEKLFSPYGSLANIFMKTFPGNKKFRGSIFLTFSNLEDAQKFKEAKPVYNDVELTVETKAAYALRKKQENPHKDKKNSEKKQEAPEPQESDLVRGALVKLTGLDPATKWEDIKTLFQPHAAVAFVDHSMGQSEALVRFAQAGSAKEALEKALIGEGEDRHLILKDKKVTAVVLEGDEEKEQLISLWKLKKANLESRKKQQRGGGGGNRARRGGKRAAQDKAEGAPKSKVTKFEE